MAYNPEKALSKHWTETEAGWKTLTLILLLLGYKLQGNGIEHGYFKDDQGYWFCDDGDIEYSDVGYDK